MDCEKQTRDGALEKYLLGSLELEAQDELEVHLLECSRCWSELEALQALRSELVSQAHEIRQKEIKTRISFRKLGFAFASLAIVLFSGRFFLAKRVRSGPPQHDNVSEISDPHVNGLGGSRSSQNSAQPESGQMSVAQKSATAPAPKQKEQAVRESGKAGTQKALSAEEPSRLGEAPVNEVARLDGSPQSSWPETLGPAVINGKSKPEKGLQDTGITLTGQQGKDLYLLGQTQAPPYVFPGLGGNLNAKKIGKLDGYGPSGSGRDAGRVLFQQGMREYTKGHYELAEGELQSALNHESDAVDTNFFLGICQLMEGHPEKAIERLQIAGALRKSPYFQSAHYYGAKADIQQMKLEAAENELQLALSVPGNLTSESKSLLAKLQALRAQLAKNP